MSAPMYESCPEIIDIINVLFTQRDDLFGEMARYVYPNMFAAGVRFDKVAPARQKAILKIEGVKGSRTLLNDEKKWLISGYKDKWEACDKCKKIAVVANMLRRVAFPTQEEINKLAEKGQDYEYGKLVKPDIEDFSSFIKTLGMNWSDDGSLVPDISKDKSLEV